MKILYQVGKKSITANSRTWPSGKPVTAELLAVTDEQFDDMIKRNSVVEAKPSPPKGLSQAELDELAEARKGLIVSAIADLFKEDGSRKADADFTQGDTPKTSSLTVYVQGVDKTAADVAAAERDEAWARYQESAELQAEE